MKIGTVILVVAIVAIVAALLAFGINDESPDLAFDPAPTISIAAGSFLRGCESDDVCYTPHDITTSAGTTMVWINDDSEVHTIASGDADNRTRMYASGIIRPGETFECTSYDGGRYEYYCTIPPWTSGSITVV